MASGPVSENFDHMDVEGAKAKAAAPPPASAFTPLVGVLSAVCLGLLIAVIAMAATIAASDGNGSSSHTTVVCPTGAPAVSAAGDAAVGQPPSTMTPVTSSPPMRILSPPPMASTGSDCPVETMYWEFPASVYGGCAPAPSRKPPSCHDMLSAFLAQHVSTGWASACIFI